MEDLEDELLIQKEKYDEMLSSLEALFISEDFDKKNEINGTAFNKKDGSIFASFYIDTDGNYKGYITNDSDNSSNYSIKGEQTNALKAADSFVDIFNQEILNGVESDSKYVLG